MTRKEKFLKKHGLKDGEPLVTAYNEIFYIIDYIDCSNVVILLPATELRSHWNMKKVLVERIKDRRISDCFTPTIRSNYCLGKHSKRVTDDPIQRLWRSMVNRCHDGYAELSDEWRVYANFEQWFNDQKFLKGWQIDSDILSRGIKKYSSKTCCMVPHKLNYFILGLQKPTCYCEIRETYLVSAPIRMSNGKFKKRTILVKDFEDACNVFYNEKVKRLYEMRDKEFKEVPEWIIRAVHTKIHFEIFGEEL